MEITIIRILSVLINVYAFTILMRIIVTWFPERHYPLGRLRGILATITDPYLNMFRKLRFLHIGAFDFSPVFALVLLSAVQIMLAEWIRRGARSIILFPIFFASTVINMTSMLCLLLFIAIIVRVILLKVGVIGSFTTILDQLLQPMIQRSFRLFGINRNMSFTVQLLIFAGTVLLLFFGFRILSAWMFLL